VQKVITVPTGAREVRVEAVILRAKPCPVCNHPDGNPHDAIECMHCGADVSGIESAREDQGTVSYWHKDPLRRAAWRISHGDYDKPLGAAFLGLAALTTIAALRRRRRR
jgi:MYXO-CTERM domain-containing protein